MMSIRDRVGNPQHEFFRQSNSVQCLRDFRLDRTSWIAKLSRVGRQLLGRRQELVEPWSLLLTHGDQQNEVVRFRERCAAEREKRLERRFRSLLRMIRSLVRQNRGFLYRSAGDHQVTFRSHEPVSRLRPILRLHHKEDALLAG